jgi:hypothetical protein
VLDGRATKILGYCIRYRALSVGKEDHDGCSIFAGSVTRQGTRLGHKPFRTPVLYHDILAGPECRREVRATARPSGQHGVQEPVWGVLEVIYQYVFNYGIE